ncbi:MAG: class I SAM-dependent rRNA methyltransferase, partial [Duncaniella sp.]|nr:class I SAM-dependent rRNA methyltransferase [Duncaniella sp.]
MSKTITLKRGKEDSLLRFHPWVFSGAIANLPEGLEEGDTVSVVAADGRPL